MTHVEEITYPRLMAIADSALLIEFENRIDDNINSQVLNLKTQLDAANIAGVLETVPSYRSLLVHYNCLQIDLAGLSEIVEYHLSSLNRDTTTNRSWRVPVCYGGEAGADLDDVARIHDMTTEDVIRLHRDATYRVYMVGFAPGWSYLGGLDPKLHTPRLDSPRLKVPAGCISIGGQQGMIGGLSMPSGWRLLGQTPVRTYDPNREPPFFISAGDEIHYYEIDTNEFERMSKAAEKGELVAEEFVAEEVAS